MKQISKAVSGQKRAVTAQKNTVVKAKSTKAAKGIQPEPKLVLDPCCKEFLTMEHDDFNALKESILRNGQLQPRWCGRDVCLMDAIASKHAPIWASSPILRK